ncbi:MAG: protein kinase [Planctomycetota bacterium]
MDEHPSARDLERFANGIGDEATFSHIERHIGQCDDCLRRLESYSDKVAVDQLTGIGLGEDSIGSSRDSDWLNCDTVSKASDSSASDLKELRDRIHDLPSDASGRYRLDREIARGGMGCIAFGRDNDLQRDIAIKFLQDEHCEDEELVRRFVNEARIGGMLQHPGIVPVYELGTMTDERPFFSMKLVEGQTLAERLSRRRDFECDLPGFLGVFQQICQTMAYAHNRGVIHRDLKPSNIMIGPFGEVQVMDWGLAKVLSNSECETRKPSTDRRNPNVYHSDRDFDSTTDTKHLCNVVGTQFGCVIGTPAYMPPEQANGRIDDLDQRSDVFGLGAILCEILTGSPPYRHQEPSQVYRMAATASLVDCQIRLDDCNADPFLVQIAKDCLEVRSQQRPADAGQVAHRVTEHLQSAQQRAHRAELKRHAAQAKLIEQTRRRRVQLRSAAAVLLVSTLALFGFWRAFEKDRKLRRKEVSDQIDRQRSAAEELNLARTLTIGLDSEMSLQEVDFVSLNKAIESLRRAAGFLGKDLQDDDLSRDIAELHADLGRTLRDASFLRDIRDAWDQEMLWQVEYNSFKPDKYTRDGSLHWSNSKLITAYEDAFRRWGVEKDDSAADVASRIAELTADDQIWAIVAMQRWRQLLTAPWTLEQWDTADWQTLEAVRVSSRGGDQLRVLEDGSILANGDEPRFGYELEMRSGVRQFSALRLEFLTHDSLPDRGPGRAKRSQVGSLKYNGLSILCGAKGESSDNETRPVIIRSAVADTGQRDKALTPHAWAIPRVMVGRPHRVVLELQQTLHSKAGFRLRISHADIEQGSDEDRNLGRFRWSVATRPMPIDTVRWLDEAIEFAEKNPWRRELQREIRRRDMPALVMRSKEIAEPGRQPSIVLTRLAEALRQQSNSELYGTAAVSLLNRISRREPDNFWVAVALSEALLDQPKPNRTLAARSAAAAVALRPASLASHVVAVRSLPLGRRLLTEAELHTLHHHASEIRRLFPSSDLRFLLSEAAYQFHEAHRLYGEQEIANAYRRCLEAYLLHPTYGKTRWGVGFYLDKMLSHGQYAEVEAAATRTIAIDPSFTFAYPRLAGALWHQGKRERAAGIMRQAATMIPEAIVAKNNLAWDLICHHDESMRHPDAAIKLAKLSLQAKPDDSTWHTLGAARYESGDLRGALQAFDESLAISNHSSGWCYVYRSLVYSDLGESDIAREWLRRARKWNEQWAKGDSTFEWLKSRAASKLAAQPASQQAVEEKRDQR